MCTPSAPITSICSRISSKPLIKPPLHWTPNASLAALDARRGANLRLMIGAVIPSAVACRRTSGALASADDLAAPDASRRIVTPAALGPGYRCHTRHQLPRLSDGRGGQRGQGAGVRLDRPAGGEDLAAVRARPKLPARDPGLAH